MKLVRYGAAGKEKPGIVGEDGKIRDLSRIVKDIDGAMLADGGLAKIKKANLNRLKPVPGRPRLTERAGRAAREVAREAAAAFARTPLEVLLGACAAIGFSISIEWRTEENIARLFVAIGIALPLVYAASALALCIGVFF